MADISNFDETLLGVVDLTRTAFGEQGLYLPALALAALAGLTQFYQSRQLMPDTGDSRSLRQILSDESKGKRAEQSEINAAMGRNMRYLFPVLTFVFASSVPGALALYWAAGSIVGWLQQRSVLNQDVEEMEEQADKLEQKPKPAAKPKTTGKTSRRKRRRK